MSIIQGHAVSSEGGYQIAQSLRFNDDDSAYLSRTPSVAGNRKTWTWSGWVKRGNIDSVAYFVNAVESAKYHTSIGFVSDGTFDFIDYSGTATLGRLVTNQVFRDVSSWYHIVCVWDTTNTNADDRIQLYVNGVRVTSFSAKTNPALNSESNLNKTALHRLGMANNGLPVYYFDGYIAETYLIDGQALTPDYFGEFDSTYGHWKPIKYTGAYGTNGFYLPFDDAGFIGKDKSTTLGSNLVTNGTFDVDLSGWTDGATSIATWIDGRLKYERNNSSVSNFYQSISVENGKTYEVSMGIYELSSASIAGRLYVGTTANGAEIGNISWNADEKSQRTLKFTATATGNIYVSIFYSGLTTGYMIVDNVSLREIVTQGNDFTATNLSATDVVLDSPTNNFAVWNNLASSNFVYSEGNLKIANTVQASTLSSILLSGNKYYCEFYISSATSGALIGINKGNTKTYPGGDAYGYGYYSDGSLYNSSLGSAYGASYTTGDIIGVAIDLISGTLEFFKNNVSQGIATSSLYGEYFVGARVFVSGQYIVVNFGQDSSFAGNKTPQGYTDSNGIGDFYYQPPTGYLALCTANLPEPTVVPSEHFDVVTYTGNSSTQTIATNIAPELTWIKCRSYAYNHALVDIIRGDGYRLYPNLTNTELPPSTEDSIHLLSNGFEVVNNVDVNLTTHTYVAWNWKAGGAPVTNNDGTITSQVSANVDAGFSIVSWTSDGSTDGRIGHGLSSAPELVITKNRNGSNNWYTMITGVDGSLDYLYLNLTNAKANATNGTVPTTTTFSNSAFSNGNTMIAYCFHSVEGYSKIGTYIGNGSTDGTFIYCNHKPKYVMIKRTDTTGNWGIYDIERDEYNVVTQNLTANTSNAEGSVANALDITSNGFKLRTTNTDLNASGGTYLFISFAESPFKYSNGR